MSLSLPFLRPRQSTIYAAPSGKSANVVQRAVESPASINSRLSQQQQHYESSITEWRRRLTRKASTFSLRSKSRRGQSYLRAQVEQEEESDTASVETLKQGRSERKDIGTRAIEVTVSSLALPEESDTHPAVEVSLLLNTHAPRDTRKEHTSVSMSSDDSAPPVSFKRLQEIATEACNTTLESATGYVHASTAEWNTAIINGILQKLVKDTTTESQPQPAYKFIVNSTIIQHAPGGDGGRRGMHAASGAYWNNEKDGMWSFKYEAAEGKGLDVVVGIVWVWIG